MEVARSEPRTPRPSASVMLRRGDEILVCHRVSTVPAFPDYWAFPGGGVSRVDQAALASNPAWFPERDEDERAALVALFREMVEEVGLTTGSDGIEVVDENLRARILEDKGYWSKAADSGDILVNGNGFTVISERTTPPLAPLRFRNHFFTMECDVEPILIEGENAEFDDFRWATPQQLLDEWHRHEIRLPPPLVMILRELVTDAIENSIDQMSISPSKDNDRIEFAPGVECLPLPTATLPPATHTNCYILGVPGGERIIIDPAAKNDEGLALLQEKVDQIMADGSTIIATIFTHRHADHIGDLSAISNIYQAPIWASSETLETISPCDSDRVLKEGDMVKVDEVSWSIIETPGHCPGQLCLVSQAGIISADNVVQVGTILVPSGEGDMTAYIEGLYRLRDYNANLLFPGHGPVVTNPNKQISHYIEHREKRHEAVFTAWQNGLREIEELSHAAYADTPDAHPMLKIDQTMSHLDALRKEGRI
ncbi:MAG: MBL fold metallo-hydrolase [Candidatus Thalassarchaeum sp.]|nr:MBL fold metallo-hydrolase [Candidatus Thalassarchaeum sp.]